MVKGFKCLSSALQARETSLPPSPLQSGDVGINDGISFSNKVHRQFLSLAAAQGAHHPEEFYNTHILDILNSQADAMHLQRAEYMNSFEQIDYWYVIQFSATLVQPLPELYLTAGTT